MGAFSYIKKYFTSSTDEKKSADVISAGQYDYIFSANGEPVNDWTALGVSTVMQCVNVLANGISQVPLKLYGGRGRNKKEATFHKLYYLMNEKPNKYQTSFDFRQMVMLWLALRGECVVWIIRSRGVIQELIPFAPHKYTITEEYKNGWAVRTYHLQKESGETVAVKEDDIWHIKWRSFDVRSSLSQLSLLKDTLSIAIAQNEHAEASIKNGARFPGLLTATGLLNEESQKRIQEQWRAQTTGRNANKTPVIGADLHYQQMAQSNTDAQYLENRQFQIKEICRGMGVSPYMVYEYENNNSYSSSEQSMLQHLTYTMSPIYKMFEDSASVNLLTDDERMKEGLYFAFTDNALLRADTKTRSEFYRTAINSGFMTPNEVREKEDLPPKEGGDDLLVQGAMVKIGDVGKWQNEKINDEGTTDPSIPTED